VPRTIAVEQDAVVGRQLPLEAADPSGVNAQLSANGMRQPTAPAVCSRSEITGLVEQIRVDGMRAADLREEPNGVWNPKDAPKVSGRI
jgi:hypothetical protein